MIQSAIPLPVHAVAQAGTHLFQFLKIHIWLLMIFVASNSSFSQDSLSHTKKYESFDECLFRSIYSDSTGFKTAMSFTVDESVMPIAILMPIATFVYGRAYNKTYDENTGYLLAFSQVTNLGLTFGIKELVKRKRPFSSLSGVYQRDKSTHDPYSFPSGHTSTSFTIATLFALRYPKYPQAYVPMYLWSLLAAYGRPYLGMHYPTDLLGGAIVGAGSSILIYSLRSELFKFKNNVLKESKTDEGSINGGVVSIFAGSFLISEVLNTFLIKRNNMNVWLDAQKNANSNYSLNLNWHF